MKIDVAKILSEHEIEAILLGGTGQKEEEICSGDIVDLTLAGEGVAAVMDEWTRRMENRLLGMAQLEQITSQKIDQGLFELMRYERGITLDEYLEIFYTTLDDSTNLKKYIGFRFFNILNERVRLRFINTYTQDAEGYVQALMKANLSVMSFFLGGRLKAYLPLPKSMLRNLIWPVFKSIKHYRTIG